MLKLFGTGKKKKSSRGGGGSLKPGNVKIPIPMINGVQYANLTESQISTLIGGGNKGDLIVKKPVSSISSQRTNNTTNTEKTPAATNYSTMVPSRSISSPPVLAMPKPIYSIPPTRSILRSHDYEKTQVESNSGSSQDENSTSSESVDNKEDIIKLLPTNNNASTVNQTLLNDKSIEDRERSSVATVYNEGAIAESQREESNKNHQSVSSVTRTSDDSIRQYISASESPFFTNSSVSNMNNNLLNAPSTFSSSPLNSTTSTQEETRPSIPRNNIDNTSTPSNNPHASFVSARSLDTDLINNFVPAMEANPLSQETVEVPTHIKTRKETAVPLNNDIANGSPSPTEGLLTQKSVTPQKRRETTQMRSANNNRVNSSSPGHATIATTIPKQTRVTRPASSSGSSATIGLDVTPTTSQSRLTNNNSAKPPGNQLRSNSSESSGFALHQNNNNNKTNSAALQPQITLEKTNPKIAISDMQSKLQKMALSEDLEELKRTVDLMQQQRVSDREEHLTRVKEQKLREQEILDQINLTKQRLEMAIAGKFFMEDLLNTNDATQKAINASLPQQQADEIENLQLQQLQQQEQQQQHLNQQQQQQPQKQKKTMNNGEEEYMIKSQQPSMKPSTSNSSARSRLRASSSETLRQQPDGIMQQENNNRPRAKKTGSSYISNQAENRQNQQQHDPYLKSSESYFPDVSKKDFDYMGNLHESLQQHHQFFPPIPNKFRNPNGNMRNYYADMDGGNSFDPFVDSPRIHNGMRPQRRQRSKSVESQWLVQDPIDQQQQQLLQQQQQFQHRLPRQYQQRDGIPYDYIDPMDGYRVMPVNYNGRTRSRKSSTHSSRSNLSDGGPVRSNSNHDIQSGYHSAAEEDELADVEDDARGNDNNNRPGDHTISGNSSRHNSDGEQRHPQHQQQQQYQYDDPAVRRPSRTNSGRYRRRPPQNNEMGAPMPPPSIMYHNPAFGPPPPHMSHMGMMNDRDRMKMRPPPYGYSNVPPSGTEYYNKYIPPPQRVSPRMVAAFTDEQQWNGPPPPHHPQWAPGNQNMYGIHPPPQGVPENINNGGVGNTIVANGSAVANNGNVNVPPPHHHVQDAQNESNFPRRYPPPQSASLQQTPQQSQHGYLSLYTDAPRIYM